MLAIAAVTLSTMHQSSLGSLFLLMPDKLAPQWWSPVMPISFFLSSIAAGTSLVVLIEMWIAKAWGRRLQITQLAALGQISFWSLLCYWAFRLVDMAFRGQFSNAFSGRLGALFAVELFWAASFLWSCSLALRCGSALRCSFSGPLLAAAGVVFNRVNVVLLAMDLKGADASDRTSVLHSVRFRMGRLCWPYRCEHLSFRARSTTHADSPQGRDRHM